MNIPVVTSLEQRIQLATGEALYMDAGGIFTESPELDATPDNLADQYLRLMAAGVDDGEFVIFPSSSQRLPGIVEASVDEAPVLIDALDRLGACGLRRGHADALLGYTLQIAEAATFLGAESVGVGVRLGIEHDDEGRFSVAAQEFRSLTYGLVVPRAGNAAMLAYSRRVSPESWSVIAGYGFPTGRQEFGQFVEEWNADPVHANLQLPLPLGYKKPKS